MYTKRFAKPFRISHFKWPPYLLCEDSRVKIIILILQKRKTKALGLDVCNVIIRNEGSTRAPKFGLLFQCLNILKNV